MDLMSNRDNLLIGIETTVSNSRLQDIPLYKQTKKKMGIESSAVCRWLPRMWWFLFVLGRRSTRQRKSSNFPHKINSRKKIKLASTEDAE